MDRFRARDLLLVPSLLSLARVPLAALFPFVVGRPALAFAVLVVAGLTDVADGWYARRFGQATPTGAVVDPVTDKLFVLAVVLTLVFARKLPLIAILLLSARELGELPLVFWFLFSHDVRRARATKASANAPGKLATAMQFVTVAAALFGSRLLSTLLSATAGAGIVAAAAYWTREVSAFRAHTRSERRPA